MPKDPIKEFYEQHYAKLELTAHMLRRIKLTEDAIEKFAKSKESILEIGCGTGENLSYYVNKFHFTNAYCVEIASFAEMEIREKGITPFILDVNVTEIPLEISSIDVLGR
ncbi:class I SAM-dependent methyltransferase [Saccharolobus solfataricus]|nr:class I SAM-dependent methyltransferase [Saccharolobus solfataricus]